MRYRMAVAAATLFVLSACAPAFAGGPLLFDTSEYAARRARLMERIPDGVAILLGAYSAAGYGEFVQNNDMMYFAGVEIPNAGLIIDGRSKTSTLFFTITDSGARNEGISLDLVHDAAAVTGIERVARSSSSRWFSPGWPDLTPSSTHRSSQRSWPASARPRSSASCRTP